METYPVLYRVGEYNYYSNYYNDTRRIVIHEPELNIDLNIQNLTEPISNKVYNQCPNCLFRYEVSRSKPIQDIKNVLGNIVYCNCCLYLQYNPEHMPTSISIPIYNMNYDFQIILFLFALLFLSISFG